MSAEDRVRTAAEATAESVRHIRPLTLPDKSEFSTEPRRPESGNAPGIFERFRKVRDTWIIPLGAAAAVAVLAVSLVVIRHSAAPSVTPTQAGAAPVTGIPRYYAIATEGPVSHDEHAAISVAIGDAYTGKTLTTVSLPGVMTLVGTNSAVGVSGASDDRTFVVGRRNIYGGVTYFQVRIAPGTKQVATVKQLPIRDVALGNLLGFAVSPDGSELAVLSVRGNGTTMRLYSLKSGAVLRTWIASTWRYQGDGLAQAGVSWTADGRQVAFSTAVGGTTYSGVLEERLIAPTAPSGDLATASKLVFKAPGNCSSLLLTPDGGTVVCATLINYPPATSIQPQVGSPGTCGTDGPRFVAYSTVTGKFLRVLYQYQGPCTYGVFGVLWTDADARHVIGESWTSQQGNSFDRYGVAAAGNFTKFQVAKHGQWYAGPAF